MADENTLELQIRLQAEQATATMKVLGTTLEGLAKSASTATAALDKQAEATNTVAKAAGDMSVKAQLLDTLHAKFAGTLGDAQKAMSKYAEEAGAAGEFLGKMGLAGVAAAASVGLLVEKGREGVVAWSEWERQALRFDLAMKATGQSAKASFAQLHNDALAISRGTIWDGDQTASVMAKLARNTVLTMEKVRQLTPQVLDIAASTGRSPTDVASSVGLLYSNPERAVELMARSNPNMTPTDRRGLQERVRSGQGEAVADDVVKRMASSAAGQATALTAGVAGAYSELKKNMEEWAEASSRSLGRVLSDTLHLEDALHAAAKAMEMGKEAAENRFRGLTATTPQDRIAGAQQRLRDIQANPLEGVAGVDLGDTGFGATLAAQNTMDARIKEQRDIIEQNEELVREQSRASALSDKAVQAKIDKRTYSNAAEILNQADQMSAKQKELRQQIDAYESGLAAVGRAAPGAFDASEVDRMRAALVKTKNELDSLKDGFDAVNAAIPADVFSAGLSGSDKTLNDEYTKLAAKVGEKYKLNANQLSIDPLTRAANPNSMAPDQFKAIMDELMSLTIGKLQQMEDAQFNRNEATRTRELALILKGMEPGSAGQRAAAELEVTRSTQGITDSGQKNRAYQAELNNKLVQENYKAQIEMQQQLQKFSLQADQARLQGALLTGGTATISDGTFSAGGSANASAIATILRGKYGANDTAIAAVLGHFQQESGLNPTKEHLDSNGYVSKGLGQWQKSRAAGLEAFAGVDSGGKATVEQQLDYMMKEIKENPKFRAMWARMNSGGISLDDATDAFGSYEGYGDNSGATRRANARSFMSGGTISFRAAGPVGDEVAKRQAALLPQANDFAQKFGIPTDDALRTLMGADAQAFSAENDLQLKSMMATNQSTAFLNASQASGGNMGRNRMQWSLDAFNKGFTGPQGIAYVGAQQGSLDNVNTKALLDKLQNQRESNELTNKEAELATATAGERQRELDLLRLSQEAKRLGYDTDSAAYKAQVEAINQSAEAQDRLRRAQGPLGSWLADSREDWKTWEDTAVSAISATENDFANLITGTGTLQDGISGLLKSFASLAANSAMKSLFGAVGNNLFGDMFSGGSTSAFNGAGTTMAKFADGGIMGPMGNIPLRRYASGGVATSPQLALFGEGAHNEAYVPLPDGRSIPVSMSGGGGNQSVIAPNITVNVTGGGGQQSGAGAGAGMDPKQMGDMVAAAVHAKIIETMTQESRPGGALNPVFG